MDRPVLVIMRKGNTIVGRVIVASLWDADSIWAKFLNRQVMHYKYDSSIAGELNAEYRNADETFLHRL